MADLFQGEHAGEAGVRAQKRVRLHDETDIYAAVAELAKYIARVISDLRRDLKPTYGIDLKRETSRLAVLVREVNIARGEAKLPYLDEILRIVEYIKFDLKTLRELGQAWLPNKTYEASIPLTASIGKQAQGLKAAFAPAP